MQIYNAILIWKCF